MHRHLVWFFSVLLLLINAHVINVVYLHSLGFTMAEHTSRLNSSLSDAAFKTSCDNVLCKLVRPDQSTIDLILSHDDPKTSEIIVPDGRKFVWYFAIGSMMNPISLYLRDITPIVSYPAKCLNYKLVFRGFGGMADIESCPENEFHGVVHLLSHEDMTRLDALEFSYRRIPVDSINYQGESHVVGAYQMNMSNIPTNIPSERYLDVIIKGCEYFKVQPDYVTRLKAEQAVVPRKQPHTFKSFTDIPPNVYYSSEELARHNGNDPSLPMWTSINGKILEYIELPYDENDPNVETQKRTHMFIRSRFAGREATHVMAKALYEPLYPLSADEHQLCEEQQAQLEDELYSRVFSSENKNRWQPIGRLRETNNS